MNLPQELKYTKDHEWIRLEGKRATIGITDFAQSELGDIVFIEVPVVGTKVKIHGGLSVVESVKAVSDIYVPLTGTIVEVNEELTDQPELVNQDPYGAGWIVVIELEVESEVAGLIGADAYLAVTQGGK